MTPGLLQTLEALGWAETLHAKVFHAVHVERLGLNTDALIQAWIDKQGVDGKKFAETYKSFGVAGKAKRATQMTDAYKVGGVPALGVAGRWYVDGETAGSLSRALQVTDALIAQAKKG